MQSQIDHVISQCERFSIGADDLEAQLKKGRDLSRRLNNLLAVCGRLGEDAEGLRMRLNSAHELLHEVISNLETARWELQRAAPDSPEWRTSLQTGQWLSAEQALREVKRS